MIRKSNLNDVEDYFNLSNQSIMKTDLDHELNMRIFKLCSTEHK